jgi:hypothetical protein
MAHFAELDKNNVVLRVCVVDNKHVPSDKHVDGETWCTNFWGGTWKQTSYNNNFRKQYAGKNYTYNATKDIFIAPQPHASWTLDDNDEWEPPIPRPSDDKSNGGDKFYYWDESVYQGDNTKGWIEE